MAFREGILVFSQPGALPAASLEQVIAGVRELDMDDVRAQTASPDCGTDSRNPGGVTPARHQS